MYFEENIFDIGFRQINGDILTTNDIDQDRGFISMFGFRFSMLQYEYSLNETNVLL